MAKRYEHSTYYDARRRYFVWFVRMIDIDETVYQVDHGESCFHFYAQYKAKQAIRQLLATDLNRRSAKWVPF